MSRCKISIVLLTLNGEATIGSVLEGIMGQDIREQPEILCIDSGSKDNTLSVVERFPVRIIPIAEREFHHSRTRNLGACESRGEKIVYLTQDAIPRDSRWLRYLVGTIGGNGNITGAADGNEIIAGAADGNGTIAGAYSRQIPGPHCHPFVADRLRRWAAAEREPRIQNPVTIEALRLLPLRERLRRIAFDDVSSCIDRSVWERIPFPESDFGEDVSWAFRVLSSGYRIVYEPRSVVLHDHRWSFRNDLLRIARDHQNLAELLGEPFVPSFSRAIRNGVRGTGTFWRIAGRVGSTPARKVLLYLLSAPYSLSQSFAQYAGGIRARRKGHRIAETIHNETASKRSGQHENRTDTA
jgi:rhamnosyltransferase